MTIFRLHDDDDGTEVLSVQPWDEDPRGFLLLDTFGRYGEGGAILNEDDVRQLITELQDQLDARPLQVGDRVRWDNPAGYGSKVVRRVRWLSDDGSEAVVVADPADNPDRARHLDPIQGFARLLLLPVSQLVRVR